MFNPGNYFIPGYGVPFNYMAPARGLGIFRNIGRGMGFFRNINWSSLFSNTQRALGVVNQAIPIVKQAGPMFSNMRSMLRVASAFKDITDSDTKKTTSNNTSNFNSINNDYTNKNNDIKYNNDYSFNSRYVYNSPNFFI